MRPSDIVNQLRILLPRYTRLFDDQLQIDSIAVASGVATITTLKPHGMITGDAVTLSQVESRTPISEVSKDGLVVTITTSLNHDLTENWQEEVTLSGFNSTTYNGTFKLQKVPNRKNFTIQNTEAVPVLSGLEVLHEVTAEGVNGMYSVTVTGDNTFTVTTEAVDGNYFGGFVSSFVRVAASATAERAVVQYDEFQDKQLWMFVIPESAEVSKDRSTLSDAVGSIATGQDIRMRLIDPFSLLVFVPTDNEFAAEEALDICRHDLLLPLTKSLFGAKFPSGLSSPMDFKVVMTAHDVFDYTKAYYVHQYTFEAVYDLTECDAVEPTNTRAFRDINYTQQHGGADTLNLTANINLDDEPLE